MGVQNWPKVDGVICARSLSYKKNLGPKIFGSKKSWVHFVPLPSIVPLLSAVPLSGFVLLSSIVPLPTIVPLPNGPHLATEIKTSGFHTTNYNTQFILVRLYCPDHPQSPAKLG